MKEGTETQRGANGKKGRRKKKRRGEKGAKGDKKGQKGAGLIDETKSRPWRIQRGKVARVAPC